jgi:hypothetical protein
VNSRFSRGLVAMSALCVTEEVAGLSTLSAPANRGSRTRSNPRSGPGRHCRGRSGALRSNDWRRPLYATVVVRFAIRPRSAICATCRLTSNGRRSGLALLCSFSRGVAIARCRDGASGKREFTPGTHSRGDERPRPASFNSTQAGAWSLAPASPRTSWSTPAPPSRFAASALNGR